MKTLYSIIFSLLALSDIQARLNIQVVYPRKDQQIALVDSTFIFGNTSPTARLYINGSKVSVYRSGGWLAFLPVSPGPDTFHIVAVDGVDSATNDWPIVVGSLEAAMPGQKYIPRELSPSRKAMYLVNDQFEFTFKAPPGGSAWFALDDRAPIQMYQSLLPEQANPASVFEMTGSRSPRHPDSNAAYIGYYKFAASDTGIHSLCYQFRHPAESNVENPVVRKICLDTLITVLPEYPPIVGVLSGQNHIIRTAPGMGYKLLYLPPGILVNINGIRDNFYQILLADGNTGFVNADSVTILSPGTFIPEGIASYVSLDSIDGGVKLSVDIGVRLPYEISEDPSRSGLDIDLYGVTSNIDWIRYNAKNPVLKLVKWSQPQDHVFRLSLEFVQGQIWGYKPYYRGNTFILEIRRKPYRRAAANPFKGLKIALDPGHSHDSGAIGPTGLQEQDANLWIAHDLRKMLESKGAKVLMTRYGHEDVKLYDRPAKADAWGADLLISIHNNALPDGVNPFVNNGTSAYYYYPHSEPLAGAIHRHMVRDIGLPDHGLYYGNLVLTRYSAIPSVLVECTFMMLPDQEALLRNKKFHRKCARAIMEGIEDFVKEGK